MKQNIKNEFIEINSIDEINEYSIPVNMAESTDAFDDLDPADYCEQG